MDDLFFARAQMATSLAFHIVFAVVGIGMPLLMVLAEWRWLRTGDAVHLELAKRWAKGTAILFAVGAVSGTVLSFELGLLWPAFMAHAGAIIGMPFSLEGFAFFTEAIFLGIYLYAWRLIPPRAHLLAGVVVALSGALSGIFVVSANAWMNAPTGFRLVDGAFTDIDPIAALFNAAMPAQVLHMTLAAYAATGFGVAGIHAWALRRGTPHAAFHRGALQVPHLVGRERASRATASGDRAGRDGRKQALDLQGVHRGQLADPDAAAGDRRQGHLVRLRGLGSREERCDAHAASAVLLALVSTIVTASAAVAVQMTGTTTAPGPVMRSGTTSAIWALSTVNCSDAVPSLKVITASSMSPSTCAVTHPSPPW